MKVAFCSTLLAASACAQAPDWENPAVFRIGKEEPRATSMPFPDRESALAKSRLESPWCQSLNGAWKFHYSGAPDQRPIDFYKPDFDVSGWPEIPVPSNWQLQGYGIPLFSNIEYPFAKNPPRVMDEPPPHYTVFPADRRNPVGSYRRSFTLPDTWQGRQVRVVFGAVDSAFYLWVNGTRIGYSEDSRTPAEFDITAALKPGENVIAAEVYQHSDGSYLEDQDMWRLSGIFRDVYLWSADTLDVRDYWLKAGLTDDYADATLDFAAQVANTTEQAANVQLTLEILKPDRSALYTGKATAEIPARSTAEVRIDPELLQGVSFWSAETPTLYPYLITLATEDGRTLACYAGKTGFRRDEVRDGQFLHNGKPVLIKGVNRHDHHPRTGHYVTAEDIAADLLQMKRANINAIRCSHYPNDPRLLELADELGFYVVAEANLETHGMGWGPDANPLAKDPAWGFAFLDRMRNCLERDKNHPSVIMWSLGNESGDGANFQEMSRWVKQRDPSRPVHYEQARSRPHVDLYSPMYASIADCLNYCREEEKKPLAEQRPLIQCEYNHAMGNSSGNLADYWEAFRSERLLQGGFIWDWKDQGLIKRCQALNAAEDRSGKGHATRLYGSLLKDEGLINGSVIVSPAADLDLTRAVTVMAEVRGNVGEANQPAGSDNPLPKGQPIFGKGDTSYLLKVDASATRLEFFIHSGTWQAVWAPLPPNWRGAFHQVAGTYDGKTLKLYIDGKEAASRSFSGPIDTNSYEVAAGIDTENPARRFNGSIRRAALYDRALEPKELSFGQAGALLDFDFTQDAAKPETRLILARGGDYNDQPNDRFAAGDGITTAQGLPSPQFEEVKKAYQDLHLSGVDLSGPTLKLRVANERFFRAADDVKASWKLLRDGQPIGEGTLNLPALPPQGSAEVTVATGVTADVPGEYLFRVRFDQVAETAWHPAGMPIAWDELALPWSSRAVPTPKAGAGKVEVDEGPERLVIRAAAGEAVIDRNTGVLSSWTWEGKPLLAAPLRLNFWRPATNNDEGAKFPYSLAVRRHAGADAKASGVGMGRDGEDVLVASHLAIPAGASDATIIWRFHPSGQISVETTFNPKGELPIIPRIGFQTEVPAGLQTWTWYGKGPHENYRDRRSGAWTAIHTGSVAQLFHRYGDPKEASNRTDIRWATFHPPLGGAGLRVDATGVSLLEIGAYPCKPDDLEMAVHTTDLPAADTITLNISHLQMGLGGTNSWGEQPLEKYRIPATGSYQWSFLLSPETIAAPPARRPMPRPPGAPPLPGTTPLPPGPTVPPSEATPPVAPPPAGE